MQSRLYLSKLGEPFLHKIFNSTKWRSSKLLKFQPLPASTLRYSHSLRPAITRSEQAEPLVVPQNGRLPSVGTKYPQSAGGVEITPHEALATYLDIQDDAQKRKYWMHARLRLDQASLPAILMYYLHTSQIPENEWDEHDHSAYKAASATLERRDLSFADVEAWAEIVLKGNTDERVQHFFATLSTYPSFLLLEICRRDMYKVDTLKTVLAHVWRRVLYKSEPPADASTSPHASDAAIESSGDTSHAAKDHSRFPTPLGDTEQNSFSILLKRLLYQCRRIWPPAMVTVAHMMDAFIDVQVGPIHGLRTPDPRLYRRLCQMQNDLLQTLALPASFEPYKSMVHNWSAQKVILALSSTFSPPLLLDEPAYQAVIQVLAASMKTPLESKSAKLRARSWPPWRIEQDGMDARREPEEDLSRVIAALERKRESGYSDTPHDQVMSILGGQEPDGTPTIQTRAIVKNRAPHGRSSGETTLDPLNPRVWASRVETTRDVREAWAAFQEFSKQGGNPNLSMYYSMFRKIAYERRRLGRTYEYQAAPGDGREVLPVPDDNISDFYKSRLQPPSQEQLYQSMISRGLRPSGQCLSFLVRYAPSIPDGIRYLSDSGLGRDALDLLRGREFQYRPADAMVRAPFRALLRLRILGRIAKRVPQWIMTDFVILLCRFAPRAVFVPNSVEAEETELASSESETVEGHWIVRQVMTGGRRSRHYHFGRQPLQHVAYLLKQGQVTHKPAWYALWEALAKRNVVLFPTLLGDPKNVHVAWDITRASLQEFHGLGLELDPEGFKLICYTFTRYAEVSAKSHPRHWNKVLEASDVIKTEFKKLKLCNNPSRSRLPRFMHSLHGVHLHAYLCSMAAIHNYEEMISALEWMVLNHRELDEVASQSANGARLLKRALVKIRISCEGTVFEVRARVLIDGIESWEGWPSDDEVALYQMKYELDHVTAQDLGEEAEEDLEEGLDIYTKDEEKMVMGHENDTEDDQARMIYSAD